jgi:plasmid maintenance system antidote protein VapI
MGIPLNRLNEVIRGKRGVTADTALRLAKLLDTSADLWLGLQNDWDLARGAGVAKSRLTDRLKVGRVRAMRHRGLVSMAAVGVVTLSFLVQSALLRSQPP